MYFTNPRQVEPTMAWTSFAWPRDEPGIQIWRQPPPPSQHTFQWLSRNMQRQWNQYQILNKTTSRKWDLQPAQPRQELIFRRFVFLSSSRNGLQKESSYIMKCKFIASCMKDLNKEGFFYPTRTESRVICERGYDFSLTILAINAKNLWLKKDWNCTYLFILWQVI